MATVVSKSSAMNSVMQTPPFRAEQYHDFANIAEAFFFNAVRNPDVVAYDQALDAPTDASRPYATTLVRESRDRVLKMAAQLMEWGVRPGEKVAILSLNRPEWTEAEMAVYAVGAVAVALYVRFSDDRLAYTLADSEATVAIVENEEQLRRVMALVGDADPATINRYLSLEAIGKSLSAGAEIRSLPDVLQSVHPADVNDLPYRDVARDDLATLYYTSGSSGMPTGVPVTHGQTLENLYQIATCGLIDYSKYERPDAPQPFVTLFLPERAHAFPARNAQLAATSPARARYPAVIDHAASTVNAAYRESLRRDLREGAAGIVPIVPKVLVAIEQRVRERLRHGGRGERIAEIVIENAAARFLDHAQGRHDFRARMREWRYQALSPLRRRIVAEIRRQVVGPEFEFFVSGGAKLPLSTAAFLWAIGLNVYEGYGSTESNCPIAVNTPVHCRLGSVGKLFPKMEAKTDPTTGELLLRGPNVATSYFKQEAKSRQVWTSDGWYRTRDIGRFDDDGFLYIDDRVDNILVAWNGENISATAVESRFVAIPIVDTAIVIGHQKPALVALISLNEEALQRWVERQGGACSANPSRDPEVLRMVREQVQMHVNTRAGHACETVRNIGIIESPAAEKQTLTATEKIRRKELERLYSDMIEELYQDRANWLPVIKQGAPDANAALATDSTGSAQSHAVLACATGTQETPFPPTENPPRDSS